MSSTVNAELNSEQVAGSIDVETTALEKQVEEKKTQEKSAVEEKRHTDEKSEGTQKIEKEDKKNPQDQLETTSTEKSDVDALKSMKESSDEKPIEKSVEKSKTLTDDQKLYVLKALNLQDAYALLQSDVIENMRLYGNISETDIDTKIGRRLYTADHGDAFTELLYMIYPSSALEI